MARKKFSVGEIFEKESNKVAESEGNTVGRSEDMKVVQSEGRKVGKSEGKKVVRSEGRKIGISESEKVGKSEDEKKDKKSFSIAKGILEELKLLAWYMDKSDSAVVEVALQRYLSDHQEVIKKAREVREK